MPQSTINYITDNGGQYRFARNVAVKIHQSRKNIEFLETCSAEKLLPNFTYISRSELNKQHLSPKQIRNRRWAHVRHALNKETDCHKFNESKFNYAINCIERNLPHNLTITDINVKIWSEVNKLEFKHDQNISNKLKKLRETSNFVYNKIKFYNLSGCQIPQHVLESLNLGMELPVGGNFTKTAKMELLAEIDRLNEKWQKHAKNLNISNFDLFEIRSRL